MGLVRPTAWKRCTVVSASASVILDPEPYLRHVRLCVPDVDDVEVMLCATITELEGTMRDARLMAQDSVNPLVPSDTTIPFVVLPFQSMIARPRTGIAELSIIIEYLEGPVDAPELSDGG